MRIEKLKLKKTKNMRDIGGLPAADGKKIKSGVLIRSGRLSKLPDKTVASIKAMGICDVVDLRTDREIAEHPPTVLERAAYHYLPLPATPPPTLTHSKRISGEVYAQSKRVKRDFGSYQNYMPEMYKFIAFDQQCQQKLRYVFNLLVNSNGCTIFHCNSGTDRTGIVAMLIETALGVDRQVIIDDYMASRTFQLRRRNWQRFGLIIAPIRLSFKRLLFAQMLPKPQYIIRLMEEIEKRYGSVLNYIKTALGVTEDEIKILKDKYLE